MPSHKKFALVMGDIVDSEARYAGATLNRKFNEAVLGANNEYQPLLASPLTITLGDEFQGLLHTTTDAFDVAMSVRRRLLTDKIRCRFVVGIAHLQTKLNKSKAWNMMGPGLSRAREKLNEKRDPNELRFSLPGAERLEPLLDAIGLSLTLTDTGWTETQLKYVTLRSQKKSVQITARHLKVSPRSVYKVLSAARWDYYETLSDTIRSTLLRIDEEIGVRT